MADLTITAANVLAAADAKTRIVTAGTTLARGKVVCRESDGRYGLAQANTGNARRAEGICLSDAAIGQLVVITAPEEGGNINLGATLTVGQIYVVSAASAGGIAPYADLASGHYVVMIGIATSASNLLMKMIDPNVTKP